MKVFYIKNKRGDFPTVVFVIGIFIVCSAALASFYISDREFKQQFEDISIAKGISIDVDKLYFYLEAGYSLEESASLVNASYAVDGNQAVISFTKSSNALKINRKLYFPLP